MCSVNVHLYGIGTNNCAPWPGKKGHVPLPRNFALAIVDCTGRLTCELPLAVLTLATELYPHTRKSILEREHIFKSLLLFSQNESIIKASRTAAYKRKRPLRLRIIYF